MITLSTNRVIGSLALITVAVSVADHRLLWRGSAPVQLRQDGNMRPYIVWAMCVFMCCRQSVRALAVHLSDLWAIYINRNIQSFLWAVCNMTCLHNASIVTHLYLCVCVCVGVFAGLHAYTPAHLHSCVRDSHKQFAKHEIFASPFTRLNEYENSIITHLHNKGRFYVAGLWYNQHVLQKVLYNVTYYETSRYSVYIPLMLQCC